jgi:hypothetical protein
LILFGTYYSKKANIWSIRKLAAWHKMGGEVEKKERKDVDTLRFGDGKK